MPTRSIRNLCWAGRKHAAAFLIGASLLPCAAWAIDGDVAAAADPPGAHGAAIPMAGAIVPGAGVQERLLLVEINQQHLDQAVLVLEDKAGVLYLWSQDVQRWRFRPPVANAAIEYQGEKYYPLSALSDVSHTYDPKELTLMIEVRPGRPLKPAAYSCDLK